MRSASIFTPKRSNELCCRLARVLLVDLRARSQQRVLQLGNAAAGEFLDLVAKCLKVRFQGAERFRVCSLDLIDNFVLHVCNNFR